MCWNKKKIVSLLMILLLLLLNAAMSNILQFYIIASLLNDMTPLHALAIPYWQTLEVFQMHVF